MENLTPVEKVKSATLFLRQKYIEDGYTETVYDINNGDCESFACDLLEYLTETYGQDFVDEYEIDVVEYGNFTGTADAESNDLQFYPETLAGFNIRMPEDFTIEEINKARLAGHGDHFFLIMNIDEQPMFFDSLNPEGVDTFFDLMLTKYLINLYNGKEDQAVAIKTEMDAVAA